MLVQLTLLPGDFLKCYPSYKIASDIESKIFYLPTCIHVRGDY